MPDHNDVLRRSHAERADVIDEVGEVAKRVDAKGIREEVGVKTGAGDDVVRSVIAARVAFAAGHVRTYDRLTDKQVKAEGAALKQADPATIKSLRTIDIDEERAKLKKEKEAANGRA